MSPKRIQLRRTKGWRKPDGATVVARPGKWGNPFRVDHDLTAAQAVDAYRDAIADDPAMRALIRDELAGRDLACWCPPSAPCHADVLLEIANGDGL